MAIMLFMIKLHTKYYVVWFKMADEFWHLLPAHKEAEVTKNLV